MPRVGNKAFLLPVALLDRTHHSAGEEDNQDKYGQHAEHRDKNTGRKKVVEIGKAALAIQKTDPDTFRGSRAAADRPDAGNLFFRQWIDKIAEIPDKALCFP